MATPRSGNFPDTRAVWISDRLAEGEAGVAEARNFVMATYQRPLEKYCMALRLGRQFGAEPEDVVNGFFASRLASPEFLRSWAGSGLRLRKWLRNGVNFYVREQLRDRNAIDRFEPPGLDSSGQPVDSAGTTGAIPGEPAADLLYDRAWATSALEGAITATKFALASAGRDHYWEIFWSSRVLGVPNETTAQSRGVTAAQVRQIVHTVADRLREAIREVLIKDGAKPADLADEIRAMLHALHDHGR